MIYSWPFKISLWKPHVYLFLPIFLGPLILWALFFRKAKITLVALIITWIVQYQVVSSVKISGDLSYAGGGAAVLLIFLLVLGTVVGVAVFPVLALPLGRPQKWKKKLAILLSIYALGLALLIVPGLIRGYLYPNVDFYGVVYDLDTRPVPGAEVTIRNCAGPKKFIADESGVVNIRAFCSIMVVDQIVRPDSGQQCLSTWFPSDSKSVANFWSYDQGGRTHNDWHRFDADNPFRFECIWSRPQRTINSDINGDFWFRLIPDGRWYTLDMTREQQQDRLKEGQFDGQLLISLTSDGGDASTNGVLRIQPINGGVVAGVRKSPFIAPVSGYQDSISMQIGKFWREHVYYASQDKSRFALFRLTVTISAKKESAKYTIRARYHLNLNGSRALDYRLRKEPPEKN